MKQKNTTIIPVVIPFHNSDLLKNTIKSLSGASKGTSNIEVTIVCSNCTDHYIRYAKNLLEDYKKFFKEVSLINEERPGKARAINTAIKIKKLYAYPYIVVVCDDVVIDKNSIPAIITELESNKTGSVFLKNKPIYKKNTILAVVQKLHHDIFYKYENYYLTGRAFGFKTSILRKFPESIVSEDLYLHLKTLNKNKKVVCINTKHVAYKKPTTWTDYLRMIKRYDYSFRQIRQKYPTLFNKYISKESKTKIDKLKELSCWNKDIKQKFIIKFVYSLVIIYQALIVPLGYRTWSKKDLGHMVRESSTTI